MLNSKLFLNPKVFDEDVEVAPTRAGFGTGLLELGEKNKNVVVLSADLTESTHASKFAEKYPERFVELGVAEQNMAGVAAGMGVSGKVPFIASYATFNPGRNWEVIRTTTVYNNAPVKVAGHHSGTMTGPDGATHQATEDISSTRAWPGIEILVGCDAIEARKATVATGMNLNPAYVRYSRDKTPLITTEKTPFKIGKVETFWESKNPKATIFATGYMVYYALLAARDLEKEKIETLVVNVSTIKPLDEKGILEAVKKSKAAVTVEDHQVMGGLGGAIAELFAKTAPTPMEFVGLQDTFAESGKPIEILRKYGMDEAAIIKAVKKVVKRR